MTPLATEENKDTTNVQVQYHALDRRPTETEKLRDTNHFGQSALKQRKYGAVSANFE